ncbi:MAG: DUF6056 family protein [Bacteroidales bacterium]|nr:DUF6056 family protein [Bacteroidales bacterium]
MKIPQNLTYALLLVATILFCWWYWVAPYYCDDWVFAIGQQDWLQGSLWHDHLDACGREHYSWDWWVDRNKWIIMADSPRLFQFLMPGLMWFPSGVNDFVTTILFFSAFMLILNTFKINAPRYNRIGLLLLALLLFLPWENGMTCLIFTENYVWPCLPLALFLYGFKNKKDIKLIWLILAGIFAGWSNEMAGCALFGGCIICAILWKDGRGKTLAMGVSALVPALCIYLSEIFNRQAGDTEIMLFYGYMGSAKQMAYFWITGAPWLLLGVIASVISWLRKGPRGKIDKMWVLLLCAALGCGLQGAVVAILGPRTMWFCKFFSILLCAYIVNRLWPSSIIKRKGVGITLWLLLLSIVVVNFVAGIVETRKMVKEEETIMATYMQQPKGSPFVNMEASRRSSILAFNRLAYWDCARHNAWCWRTTCAWTGHHYLYVNRPVPAVLQDFNITNAKKIAGENPLYEYKGWLVADSTFEDCEVVIDYYWHRKKRESYHTAFTATDGNRWSFVDFDGADVYARWGKIKRIDVIHE